MRFTSREGGARERTGSSEGYQKLMVVRKLDHVPDSLRPQTLGSWKRCVCCWVCIHASSCHMCLGMYVSLPMGTGLRKPMIVNVSKQYMYGPLYQDAGTKFSCEDA